MIPDAAVKAAREVLYENDRSIDIDYATLEAALEAAAPHLMEQAWESGWANARGNYTALYAGREIPEGVMLRNPYGAAR